MSGYPWPWDEPLSTFGGDRFNVELSAVPQYIDYLLARLRITEAARDNALTWWNEAEVALKTQSANYTKVVREMDVYREYYEARNAVMDHSASGITVEMLDREQAACYAVRQLREKEEPK